MLAKEIQAVPLFVIVMTVPSLLVWSVGEKDVPFRIILEYTLESHLL